MNNEKPATNTADTTPVPADTTPVSTDTTPVSTDTTPVPADIEPTSNNTSENEVTENNNEDTLNVSIHSKEVISNVNLEENDLLETEHIILDNDSRECYNAIKNYLVEQNESISIGNMLQLLIVGMESVESIVHMSGKERKQLVVHVIQKIVHEESGLDGFQRTLLINMAEEMVPNAIDIIINTSKGNYTINSKQGKKCCLSFLCSLCKVGIKTINKRE